MRGFADSLRRDPWLAVVTLGRRLPTAPAVESNVTRVEAIKRQMYSRATGLVPQPKSAIKASSRPGIS